MGIDARGPQVQALEQRLNDLTYRIGKLDDVFDQATAYGVIAFQKTEKLPVTGTIDSPTLERLQAAIPPKPAYNSPPDHIEVDLARQVLFVVRGEQVIATLTVSTGTNKAFRSEGRTFKADTPNGTFNILWKFEGWRKSPLGRLYKPSYIDNKQGIAIHGYPDVPATPASHGCIRIPMPFADWFYAEASPVGMTVYVHGGPVGPNPPPA